MIRTMKTIIIARILGMRSFFVSFSIIGSKMNKKTRICPISAFFNGFLKGLFILFPLLAGNAINFANFPLLGGV